jgi:cyclomaltodextrinase / maltogenic alpha-amylase / neopullulanase
MPGIPSVYYGSEWGMTGKKVNGSDLPLRPDIDLANAISNAPQPDLPDHLKKLAEIRLSTPALQTGNYQQVMVASQQFAFQRELDGKKVMVIVNSADQPVEITLTKQQAANGRWIDLLNPGVEWIAREEKTILIVDAKWGRILLFEG